MGICTGKTYSVLNEVIISEKLAQHIKVTTPHDDVIKSAEDKRRYCGLELTNGMKIVLISDPLADKSAVSMDVNIGHYSDPRELPGLAHFCEHMLFLGTKKYEEENDFDKYLSEHGGFNNAYTNGEHTNYQCDVLPLHLHGALDRFAQFFLCPLFTPSGTEREVNAVNSENEGNLQDDSRRLRQLKVSLADPEHDFNRFGTGNKETLETIPKSKGINVRDELLKFHSKYYSSNVMGLCVLGKESISELIDMVVTLFADVENKNITVPEWTQHPFGPNQLKTICYAVPIKDSRSLTIVWSIPDLQSYYTTKPGSFVGHLVGHEAKGSLLHGLKERGWVNYLSAGLDDGAKGFMFFSVDVDLTIEGQEHVDDIVTLTYQYINLVRTHGIQEWISKECQDLRSMAFHFKDKEEPVDYVSTISNQLSKYPIAEVLSAPKLISDFQPDVIQMLLDKLIPENMRLCVVSQKFKDVAHSVEKWYGTQYKLERLPEQKIQAWSNCGLNDDFKLPERNEFIPQNFTISLREPHTQPLPEIIKVCPFQPRVLLNHDDLVWFSSYSVTPKEPAYKIQADNPFLRLWFKQDNTFLLPKACISFRFYSPLAYADPVKCNMSDLLEMLFDDAINEYAYAARLSGLKYDFTYNRHGLELSVTGYNEKQPVLLKMLLEKLTNFEVDPKRFGIYKEKLAIVNAFFCALKLTRSLKNFQAAQPYEHSSVFTTAVLYEPQWTKEEKLKALEDITAEGLQTFIPQLLSKLYIEGLIEGNMTKQSAVDIANIVADIFQKQSKTQILPPSEITHLREIQLPYGIHYLYKHCNSVHKSSCVEIYYQCGIQDTKLNMLLELLQQIIHEPCFDILRTKEQLGYIVFSEVRTSHAVSGFSITVQSDNSPDYIEDRIEAFISSMEGFTSDQQLRTYLRTRKAKKEGETSSPVLSRFASTIRGILQCVQKYCVRIKMFLVEMTQETFTKHVESLVTSRLEKPKNINEEQCKHWDEVIINQYNFDRDNIEVAFVKTLTKEDIISFFKENIAADAPRRRKLSVHIISTVDDDITANEKLSTDHGRTPSENKEASKPHLITDIREFKKMMELFPPPKPYIDLKKARSPFCED